MELYTMFKLDGGSCMVKDPLDKACARPSMRLQTKTFQKAVREIAKFTIGPEDAVILKPSTHKKARLKCLGIITHMAMMKAKIIAKKG